MNIELDISKTIRVISPTGVATILVDPITISRFCTANKLSLTTINKMVADPTYAPKTGTAVGWKVSKVDCSNLSAHLS